jgi:5-methylcytosine-specific restriction endonuclease McrA
MGRYENFSSEQKKKYIQTCQKRRKDRKKKLIEYKGGKCISCGYSKCLRALSFHHRNPKDKSFPLDVRFIASKKWEVLVAESDKCDLLCANCHMEKHEDEENKRNYANQ